MGIFDTKYVHHVGTTIQPMVDTKAIVNPYDLVVINSVINNVDLVDEILETSLSSTAIKVNNYYQFINKKYPYKLPSGSMILDRRFQEASELFIAGLHPAMNITHLYSRFGPFNGYHEAWNKLLNNYNYNPSTGEIESMAEANTTYSLLYLQIELPSSWQSTTTDWETENWVPQSSSGATYYSVLNNQLGPAFPKASLAFSSTLTPKAIVKYRKKVASPIRYDTLGNPIAPNYTITENYFKFDLTQIGDNKTYYQNCYKIGSQFYFWFYEYGSGTTTLDYIVETPTDTVGQFYPQIYFRLNKARVNENLYPKMAKKIGFSYNDMLNQIEANQSIGDVESAMFTMGVSADSENPLERRYIYDFFDQLYASSSSGTWSVRNYLNNWFSGYTGNSGNRKKAIHIQDAYFKYALTFESISRYSFAGTIGPVNFAEAGIGTETRYKTTNTVDSAGVIVGTTQTPYSVGYRWYRKQISSSFYREIRVFDLSMVYWVFEQYTTTLGDDGLGGEDKELCLIPLDRSIAITYGIKDQQELYTRSFHFVFNSHIIEKIRWYQRGFFKALLQIAAIVYFVYTFDPSLWTAYVEVFGALALMQMIVQQLIINIAISYAVKVFAKSVGADVAILAAIVAVSFGLYKESFAGLTPDELLKLGSMMFDGVTDAMKDMMRDLSVEFDSFISMKTEMEKELEAAMDLLNPKVNYMAPILLGETPTDFLYRTTVFGTSGFTKLNDTGSYVDRALYLPTTSAQFDTL